MMPSEKVLDSSKTNDAILQRPRLPPKSNDLSSLYPKLFGIIAVVIFFFPVVSAKPTPDQLNPCKPNQHWVEKENGSHWCIDCGTCPEGQGLSVECGGSELLPFNSMVNCVACIEGVTFSRYGDSSSCLPCTSCSKGQVVEQSCSPKWDIKCASNCSSKDRYYDVDKGDCLKCSRCCGDDADVVVKECKEKLGAGSNMICSFDSSVNRCDQTTPQPTRTNSHVSRKEDVPYSTQYRDHSAQANDQDYLAATVIPVVIMVVLVVCVCLYFFKKRLAEMLSWCHCAVEEEDHHELAVLEDASSTDDNSKGNLEEGDKSYQPGKIISDSEEPLLKESVPEILDDTETIKKKGSKPLGSLLECESYQYLKKICDRLDAPMAGVGDYRDVCSSYGIDRYQIASIYEKQRDGPSRALIDHLAATHEQLTVAEFVVVVRKVAKRGDVAKLLEEYDLL